MSGSAGDLVCGLRLYLRVIAAAIVGSVTCTGRAFASSSRMGRKGPPCLCERELVYLSNGDVPIEGVYGSSVLRTNSVVLSPHDHVDLTG